jgi:riboflavin biosynthesis pyrimidine reductase
MTARFEAYCRRKEDIALAAEIPGYVAVSTELAGGLAALGNTWSQAMFGGPFYRSAGSRVPGTPSTSLVFVQSRDGNTVAPDPAVLGGGATDLHLLYEGLSRVDADAVLAGAATARGKEIVFSVWHPELVALRLARAKARHPAQVVVTDRGDLRFDDGLMFQEPELRVLVVTRSAAAGTIRGRLETKPWIEVIDAGEPLSMTCAMRALKDRGIDVVSAVGGRRTATALLSEGLVSDVYLTTSAVEAGEPDTPFYIGRPPEMKRVVEKAGRGPESGVRFEHFIVNAHRQLPTPKRDGWRWR